MHRVKESIAACLWHVFALIAAFGSRRIGDQANEILEEIAATV